MKLILFLLSLFGIMSALRMLREFRVRALISQELVTKTGTIACALLSFIIFFCAHDVRIAIFLVIAWFMMLSLTLLYLERREIDALVAETPRFLERWILNMRLGHSLSSARDAALRDSSARLRTLVRPLFLEARIAPVKHLFLPRNVMKELVSLAQSPHSALSRLENLREMLRQADNFRRKSGQASRHSAIQAYVMLGLQFALSAYTVHRYGWERHFDLLAISSMLAVSGVALMQRLTRKRAWKL